MLAGGHGHLKLKLSDLQDLKDVQSREDLLAGLARVGSTMGFRLSTIAFRQGPFGERATYNSVTNAPPSWVQRAGDQEIKRIDPVFHRLNTTREPFFYDADFYSRSGAGSLWEMAAPFGFVNGVSASLQMGTDRVLFWGFDSDERLPTDEERRMRLLSDTVLVGVMACSAASQILAPASPVLTGLQIEILRHVRAGKSSWVIAELLPISEDTVNFHLKRIRSILGVSSRHQAVAKAAELGLLD